MCIPLTKIKYNLRYPQLTKCKLKDINVKTWKKLKNLEFAYKNPILRPQMEELNRKNMNFSFQRKRTSQLKVMALTRCTTIAYRDIFKPNVCCT